MAVVVSSEQNEIEKFKAKGLDIKRHRQRMVGEDLEERFKDPADSFRLVFVRAMWMTGFDVPNCSTIYLDKPMRNHTLMQTIARANRVFGEKNNGLIVDYIGVFRNLQEALAIYAAGRGEADTGEVDTPVKDKQALLDELAQALDEADAFCAEHGVDLDLIAAEQDVFKRIALKAQAEDALLVNDEAKTEFLSHAAYTTKLYKAILPDKAARQYQAKASVLGYLSLQIRSRDPGVDISAILAEVEAVLDKSITPTDYFIRAAIETPVEEESVSDERAPYHVGDSPERLDLRRLDFDALAEQFKTGHRHTELEKLRGAINQKLNGMIRLNRQRMNYREQFEKLITEYNSGSANVVQVYNELLALVKALNEEERRHVAEGLSEEELALFDLLIHKPEMELSKKERQAVKKAAHELLLKLKGGLLTLDWRQHQQAQAQVRIAINDTLDELLPAAFDAELYETKCEMVYQHVFENYFGEDRSTYESLPLGV